MTRLRTGLLAAPIVIAAALAAAPARAVPPTPLGEPNFSFPGAFTHPASAASAGLALADRWLADEPFWNPAGGGPRAALSGALLRVSRQDLRAGNRNYDETPAFLDGAGLALRVRSFGPLEPGLYVFQPVLRREDNAYTRGSATPDPVNPPAVIEGASSARELRGGLAVSTALGPGRVGAAFEWTYRDDLYRLTERSGAPAAGTRRLELSGNGPGAVLGARIDRGDPASGGFSVGLAARLLPALTVEAIHAETLLAGTAHDTLRAERQGGWEVGATVRRAVSEAFRVYGALGGRSAQRWEGFDLVAGRAWEWKLAGEFHDARDPWTLRVGLGQERQSGVREPRADVLGIGFGWRYGWGVLEIGLLHRTLVRSGSPNSFDDRLVVSIATAR